MRPLADALTPDVLAELARPVQTCDPRAAMFVPGVEPKWYVFEVASRDVEAEMIKRRFGIYVPECEETTIRRGRKIERRTRLFPGYVFVFLWGANENWSTLLAIHGVIAALGALADEEIDRIRYLENLERPIALEYFEERDIVVKKRKRWRKRHKVVAVRDEIVRTRAWSALEDATGTLDGHGRNQALREVLGVSS